MAKNNEFSGKKCLITGGTKGLGLSVAHLLADQGAELFLSYRSDEAAAREAAHKLQERGVSCQIYKCDLSEEGSIDRLFEQLVADTNTLDLYIHNAAATAFKDLLEIKSHHIDKTFNITVKGFILGVQHASRMMPQGGAVIGISGMDTLKAVPRHGLLGAAKSALETLIAYYAHELAPRKIRVNGVNPGFLRTESTQKYLGPAFDAVSTMFARAVPLNREPSLEEIAEVILFLASSRASWVVGQTFNVDGGLDFALQNAE